MSRPIEAYRQLQRKVDDFSERVRQRYSSAMCCADGCDRCCQSDLSLLEVEIANLLEAAQRLPVAERADLLRRARAVAQGRERACPFLLQHRCLIYADRPVLCRTQGLPMLVPDQEDRAELSVCDLNFRDVEGIDGDCVLDLTQVNTTLVAINRLTSAEPGRRILISQALLSATFPQRLG
jgi:Fe-S-cluster containining protein